MKATKFFLCIVLSVGLMMTAQAQTEGISINSDGSNPDPSAILDVSSTTKGFLGPRMTTVQRNGIMNPAKGLLVFDTDLNGFWYHDGLNWKSISAAETAHMISSQGLVLDSCVSIPIEDVSNQNGGGAFQTTMYWQGFQATRTANLIGVATGIWASRPLDGYFRIYKGEGISGPLLYEVIIGGDNLAPYFFTNNPIPLQKDSIYTMQVEDTLNTVSWGFGGGDTYPPSTSSFGQDLNFTTYVDSCGSIQVIRVNNGNISLNQVDTIRFADGTYQTTAAVDTKLTEAEVDVFVSNNGYLTTELDGDPANEIQTLSINGNDLSISGPGGNSISLPAPTDPSLIRDTDGNTQIQTEENPNENIIRFDVNGTERMFLNGSSLFVRTSSGIGFPAGFGVNSAFVGTPGNSLFFGHAGVSEDFIGYRNNTFYFKDSPGGGDVSDPNISTNGTIFAGAFSGDGSALTGINIDDADADPSNEIQLLSKSGSTVSLSNGGGSFTDDVLTETQVDAFANNNGYITSEVDGSTTNELQTISLAVDTIKLSNGGGFVKLPAVAVPDTALPIPIRYQGAEIYVHPTENATDVDWTTAQSTCANLTAHGHSDWYLPSRLELDAMYKQSYLITGLSQTDMAKYWSNTEFDTNNAYSQRLDYGGPDPDAKTDTTGHNCRCIRKNP